MEAKKPPTPAAPLKQVRLLEHDREIALARFSPCGKYVFAAGCDASIIRWDADAPAADPAPAASAKPGAKPAPAPPVPATKIPGHDGWLQGLVFHPDAKRMFTLDSWGRLNACTYADPTSKPTWSKTDTHKGWAKNLAISPDGALLATCGVDKAVRLWSTVGGAPVAELKGHDHVVFSVAFHPDGKSLVSGDLHGVIRQWDLATAKPARTLDAKYLYHKPDEINEVGGVRFLTFSPDGHTLAAGGAQPLSGGFTTAKPAVLLFDYDTGKQRHLLQLGDATPNDGFAFDLLFHPAGFVAVVCGGAPGMGALWLWKPGEKSPFFLSKEFAHCRSVSLHKDGQRLAIAQVGRGNGGNGRQLNKAGEYEGNTSTVKIFETNLAAAAPPPDGPSRTL